MQFDLTFFYYYLFRISFFGTDLYLFEVFFLIYACECIIFLIWTMLCQCDEIVHLRQ